MTWRNPHATVRYEMLRGELQGLEGGPVKVDRITAWRMFKDQRREHIEQGIPYTVSQEIRHEHSAPMDAAAAEDRSAAADHPAE